MSQRPRFLFILWAFKSGSDKEMSSILADQFRPRIWAQMLGGGGELRDLSQWVKLYTGAQINFGDLTPYLTYGPYKLFFFLSVTPTPHPTSGRINHMVACSLFNPRSRVFRLWSMVIGHILFKYCTAFEAFHFLLHEIRQKMIANLSRQYGTVALKDSRTSMLNR